MESALIVDMNYDNVSKYLYICKIYANMSKKAILFITNFTRLVYLNIHVCNENISAF
jgi:hypothetical protein